MDKTRAWIGVVALVCFALLPGSRAWADSETADSESPAVSLPADAEVSSPVGATEPEKPSPSSGDEDRWDSFLPIFGDKARELGYELPLPFGIGVTLMNQWQDYRVKDVKLGLLGSEPTNIPGLQVSTAEGHELNVNGRFDAWIFPFLNIYGVLGYTNGETEATATLPPLPPPLPPVATLPFQLNYEGLTYGGGATLVGGYKFLFASLDYNYTESLLDIADSKITAHVFAPRVGVHGTLGPVKGALWVGAMYEGIAQRFRGSVNFLGQSVRFDVDQEPKDPWNFLMGLRWDISKRLELMVEGGIIGREQILGGLNFRF